MKRRSILKISFYLILVLFFTFSTWEVKKSIEIFTVLFVLIVVSKVYELIKFYRNKESFLKLGKRELFYNRYIASFIFLILTVVYIGYLSKINFKLNTKFAHFFLIENTSSALFYGLFTSLIISELFGIENVFYITDKGISKKWNYFENYKWEDFLDFKIIKEQSLIRFKKKNNKFIFIKYEEETFINNEDLIISKLNKNLTEDVKNINN